MPGHMNVLLAEAEVPYEELDNGIYTVPGGFDQVSRDSELYAVLEEYEELVLEGRDELDDLTGTMLIQDLQTDVKGITLHLVWDDANSSTGQTSSSWRVFQPTDQGRSRFGRRRLATLLSDARHPLPHDIAYVAGDSLLQGSHLRPLAAA